MFEGQFDKKTMARGRESDVLHQFRWTELVARLSATRDLRDELARHETGGFGAFGTARRECGSDSKRAVNHRGLATGKGNTLGANGAANDAVQSDREK